MMKKHFHPLLIASPSGGGKGTLINRLLSDYPDIFKKAVSTTTRKIREGEKQGVDRYFVSVSEFQKLIHEDSFLEHAEFAGNFYGTTKKEFNDILHSGKICMCEYDLQGIKTIHQKKIPCNFVFILPPSLEILKERLKGRGSETEESLAKRLKIAEEEINFGNKSGIFQKIFVNDDFDKFYEEVKKYLTEIYPGIHLNKK